MCFLKKVFLKTSQNLQENTCARVSFLIKMQAEARNYIKKKIPTHVFFSEFCEIFKSTTPVAASTLLPPIRAAEIVKWVRKYMDGSSESLQSLSSY